MPSKHNKKIQQALEDLHAASMCWGAMVLREEDSPEFRECKKRLQVAGYKYYQAVMEASLK